MLDINSAGLPPALAVPFGLIESAFSRLTHQVKEMSQEELEYEGPPGHLNSTGTLVAHLARVDLDYLCEIKGEAATPAMEAEYGPYQDERGLLPRVTGRTAAQLLDQYSQVIAMIRTHLSTQTDADATRVVTVEGWPEPATVRFVLWHMASHTMFHLGQIVKLKALYRAR